jgi:glycosyltransferase involved in cell wall biosynthesis
VNAEQDLQEGHVTIALAVYNGEKTIEKAVRSILEQSYRNFELYVVEDGSTDNTFEVLQSILPEDKRMHVVRMAKNAGTYSAKNLILKHFCRSEFFAHQDADDFSWKPRLEEQIKFMRNNPEIAACGTGIDEFYRDESESPTIACDEIAEFNPEDNYFHRKTFIQNCYPKASALVSVLMKQ